MSFVLFFLIKILLKDNRVILFLAKWYVLFRTVLLYRGSILGPFSDRPFGVD